MIELYGIPNCDTVKKARKWLEAEGIEYVFHDYKKEGADVVQVERWIGAEGLDIILNRRGTTWRKLPDEDKARADDAARAAVLLVEHPSMIKRPVVEYPGGLLVGFDPARWEAVLA
tara:strand:- start:579 stop:926 length:348 start_codon:yes stop_codon:yes gene_type:complete